MSVHNIAQTDFYWPQCQVLLELQVGILRKLNGESQLLGDDVISCFEILIICPARCKKYSSLSSPHNDNWSLIYLLKVYYEKMSFLVTCYLRDQLRRLCVMWVCKFYIFKVEINLSICDILSIIKILVKYKWYNLSVHYKVWHSIINQFGHVRNIIK